jgi:hypothetical protein
MIDMQLAESGELDLPYCHDGFVIGIRLEGRRVGIVIELESGKRIELVLHGVRALRMEHFRLGNIVFAVRIFRRVRPPLEEMSDILKGLSPLDPGAWENNVSYPDIIATEVEQGRATLFVLDPTVGCGITALCERVEMVAVGVGREPPAQQTAWW